MWADKLSKSNKKKKEYILHKNEISISSVTTTFEMMTEQGGVEPKNRTAGTAETGRIQTQASNMWQQSSIRGISRLTRSQAKLFCYTTPWGNCGSYSCGTISPVFALECSRLNLGQIIIWNPSKRVFLGLIFLWHNGNNSVDLKSADSGKRCTPRQMEAYQHRRFQLIIDPGEEGGCHGLQVLTALQFVPPLAVRGGWHADVHHVVSWGLIMGRPLSNLFLRYDAVDFCFRRDERNK